MSRTEYEDIELDIKEAKKLTENGKALERLRNNRDFKRVVIDGYLTDEAVRLVHLKSDANMQDANSQSSITKQIEGIGSLVNYFNVVHHTSMLAEKAIESSEEVLEALRTEEGV
jgi:hypothetical protein